MVKHNTFSETELAPEKYRKSEKKMHQIDGSKREQRKKKRKEKKSPLSRHSRLH